MLPTHTVYINAAVMVAVFGGMIGLVHWMEPADAIQVLGILLAVSILALVILVIGAVVVGRFDSRPRPAQDAATDGTPGGSVYEDFLAWDQQENPDAWARARRAQQMMREQRLYSWMQD